MGSRPPSERREGIHALRRLGAALFSDSAPQGPIPGELLPFLYLRSGAAAFRPAYVEAEARTLTLQSWFERLLADLGDVRVYLFKGLGVANSLYPAVSTRPLGDVDILVRGSHDVKKMVGPLGQLGFTPVYGAEAFSPSVLEAMYQVPFWSPRHGLLEVHHRLYRDVPLEFVERARTAARPASIFGRRVFQISPPYLALILSVHLAQSSGEIRPVWLLDLALLFQSFGTSDWLTYSIEADAADLSCFAASASLLVRELWGDWITVAVPPVRGICRSATRLAVGAYLETGTYRGELLRAAHRVRSSDRSLVADFFRHRRQRRFLSALSQTETPEG